MPGAGNKVAFVAWRWLWVHGPPSVFIEDDVWGSFATGMPDLL